MKINPIEQAVAPLKNDAILKAELHAVALIEKCRKELENAGNDLQLVAPYPKAGKVSRSEYFMAMSKRQLFQSLVTYRQGSRRVNEPEYVDITEDRIQRFMGVTKADASAQYDTFVAKLIGKIGEASEATLVGNHVWSFSVLKVITASGTQNWKTQMIINVSKLGKLFNQFPTRKVK